MDREWLLVLVCCKSWLKRWCWTPVAKGTVCVNWCWDLALVRFSQASVFTVRYVVNKTFWFSFFCELLPSNTTAFFGTFIMTLNILEDFYIIYSWPSIPTVLIYQLQIMQCGSIYYWKKSTIYTPSQFKAMLFNSVLHIWLLWNYANIKRVEWNILNVKRNLEFYIL